MKTPKDIKKALACDSDWPDCENCVYAEKVNNEEFGEMLKFHCSEIYEDALAYIQPLETRLAQVEQERDALMNDLLIADRFDCVCCVHSQDNDSCDFECDTCASPCTCFRCGNNSLYEWRGVCEENTKDD